MKGDDIVLPGEACPEESWLLALREVRQELRSITPRTVPHREGRAWRLERAYRALVRARCGLMRATRRRQAEGEP